MDKLWTQKEKNALLTKAVHVSVLGMTSPL